MAKQKPAEQRMEELKNLLNNNNDKDLKEVENPYTVTNRAIDELVSPKDTMFYLSGPEISLILTAHEFSVLPTYFGEEPVAELEGYAEKLKRYLVSKGGRGRRDILRVLRVSSGQSRENVNKNLISKILKGGDMDSNKEEED
jgi:hypothetical protein